MEIQAPMAAIKAIGKDREGKVDEILADRASFLPFRNMVQL